MGKPQSKTVGIDPGRSGGIASISSGGLLVAHRSFEKLDWSEIFDILVETIQEEDWVILELPAYSQGRSTIAPQAAKMHENSGFCYGVSLCLAWEVRRYVPRKWQKPFAVPPGLTYEARKEYLRLAALDLYPELGQEYKYHQNAVCDAVCIASYGHHERKAANL